MFANNSMGYYSSFVVKVWVGDDQKMIRGYVQHVGTQEAMHFLTFDKMAAFVMSHLNPPASHLPGQDEGVGVRMLGHDSDAPDE